VEYDVELLEKDESMYVHVCSLADYVLAAATTITHNQWYRGLDFSIATLCSPGTSGLLACQLLKSVPRVVSGRTALHASLRLRGCDDVLQRRELL
jgi:hypothetical protein